LEERGVYVEQVDKKKRENANTGKEGLCLKPEEEFAR